MARKTLNIHPPLLGMDRAWAYQSGPDYTFADGINVRCKDVFEDRVRLGSRPGLAKAFADALGTAPDPEAFEQQFYPEKDTIIREDDPTDNSGSALSLRVANDDSSYGIRRVLLHFDLSVIPDTATVLSTNLFLDIDGQLNSTGTTIYLRRLTQANWVELEATWNEYASGQSWTSPGGDYTATAQVTYTLVAGSDENITDLDALVQDAIDSRAKQLHLLLMFTNESPGQSRYRLWQSKDVADPDQKPLLTVNYEA